MTSPGKSKSKSKAARPNYNQRTSTSVQRTEILVNVYDLLPPGKLATALWWLGSSLLHTGVVVKSLNREYAFGGHDRQMSGVYWTKPGMEPPGGTFRCELLQGFTFRPDHEIEEIILETSQKFMGPSYNLLTNNCNHFTSYLCEQLTNKSAPSWLNRAASIGIALPCVVPREWIAPPDHDTAEGELLVEDEEDERTSMLRQDYERAHSFQRSSTTSDDEGWESQRDRERGGNGKGKSALRNSHGRDIPASERAPPPRSQ